LTAADFVRMMIRMKETRTDKLSTIRRRTPGIIDRGVVWAPESEAAIRAGAPVAIGVSGGKDSCALAIATVEALDAIGHTGPRILVHSDLGRVEWKDSLPTCERLAERLGLELVVVRRGAGDMMDRWLTRWRNNVARFTALSCVKVILPWSTPAMRFCTSELKTAVICRELVRRFPGQVIVSAAGIRREESANRAKAPIEKAQPKLTSKPRRRDLWTTGLDWNPIIEWTEADVRAFLAARGFDLHEGYTRYGMSRISCAFCIMATIADLTASASCPDNVAIYREMVDLEIVSTFAFQGSRWLGDVAPHLLTDDQRAGLAAAKLAAAAREAAESRIPEHLLYVKGWPTVMPTAEEAELLAEVRRDVAAALGLVVGYTTGAEVLARYAELMALKAAKGAAPVDDDVEV
jgi:3'-phosphoadenosine 5'-phosphosulfate sulfotransferase (PAPS reductase)/FAD synthetase